MICSLYDKKHLIRKNLLIISAIVLIFALLLIYAFYNGLVARTYEISSDKLPAGTTYRIVLITDLHSTLYGEKQKNIIDLIKRQNPDIIALAGDIVDDNTPIVGTEEFLEGIQGIAPIYYVTGNHEYWSGNCAEIKAMISGYGVTILNNESRIINIGGADICLFGIEDPEAYNYPGGPTETASIEEALNEFSSLDDSRLNILLAHRPELIDKYAAYGFDLVLSGHTHGGQVRIPPFSNGLFT